MKKIYLVYIFFLVFGVAKAGALVTETPDGTSSSIRSARFRIAHSAADRSRAVAMPVASMKFAASPAAFPAGP